MSAKILKIGIISKDDYIERMLAVARGEYIPEKNEPKVWFESIKSMSQVLSNENQELLRVILKNNPKSITEIENITGRKKSNLSRTLKTLEKYGIIKLKKDAGRIIPIVKATDFSVEFGLNFSSSKRGISA